MMWQFVIGSKISYSTHPNGSGSIKQPEEVKRKGKEVINEENKPTQIISYDMYNRRRIREYKKRIDLKLKNQNNYGKYLTYQWE
uniref:Uncharacterized protein n=1 Tax=Cucumis melo TaxID=3656 RepID=A0A9I9EEK4_CUCME